MYKDNTGKAKVVVQSMAAELVAGLSGILYCGRAVLGPRSQRTMSGSHEIHPTEPQNQGVEGGEM